MRIKAKTKNGQIYYIIAIENCAVYVVDSKGKIGWCDLGEIEVIDNAYLPKEVTENE